MRDRKEGEKETGQSERWGGGVGGEPALNEEQSALKKMEHYGNFTVAQNQYLGMV